MDRLAVVLGSAVIVGLLGPLVSLGFDVVGVPSNRRARAVPADELVVVVWWKRPA